MAKEVKKANNTIQTLTNSINNLVKIVKEHIWGQILVMSNILFEWIEMLQSMKVCYLKLQKKIEQNKDVVKKEKKEKDIM